ncbi:hypothetical protein [Pseudomonas amygdali]|uniref:hypothetical protein n=1 Tax=Pseudomonas amygdali TaxID=47877 RepID=UPI000C32C005|nr:hypothetical protein [Pseudomonas amygdali]PWC98762.1 hypothetical protein CX658_32215 [Pseudomonas amygdali pv. lachrymans]PWC98812.1 hypothetical protein CX658_31860 [Pseudomonas amygdali pv. lachrymans]
MRIYSTAQASDLLTVKRQGQKVAEAWQEQRGLSHVTVRAIKRVDGFGKNRAACGCKLWDFEIGYHSQN